MIDLAKLEKDPVWSGDGVSLRLVPELAGGKIGMCLELDVSKLEAKDEAKAIAYLEEQFGELPPELVNALSSLGQDGALEELAAIPPQSWHRGAFLFTLYAFPLEAKARLCVEVELARFGRDAGEEIERGWHRVKDSVRNAIREAIRRFTHPKK